MKSGALLVNEFFGDVRNVHNVSNVSNVLNVHNVRDDGNVKYVLGVLFIY